MIAADLVILTEHTLHIAMTEEDIANALLSRNDGLLTPVNNDGPDLKPGARSAIAHLFGTTVSVTVSRTASTIREGT